MSNEKLDTKEVLENFNGDTGTKTTKKELVEYFIGMATALRDLHGDEDGRFNLFADSDNSEIDAIVITVYSPNADEVKQIKDVV